MSKTFYADLPSLPNYDSMFATEGLGDLPPDWILLLTDVKGSTRAIQDGRYKQVNMAGVSSIIAVQNALGDLQFPFIFGGDGATLAVPAEAAERAKRSLCHARRVAREALNLDLRVAAISAQSLLAAGAELKVAKLRISSTQDLAVLRGEGWTLAEKWMKERSEEFSLPEDTLEEGGFDGLECRWNPLPARKDEIMAVIIKACGRGVEATRIYQAILSEIFEPDMKPLSLAQMILPWPPRFLSLEAKMRIRSAGRRLVYLAWNYLKVLAQKIFLASRGERQVTEPIEYLRELTENTDHVKFDECLRMVIDVSRDQKARLLERLENHARQGEILYGYHCDRNALLTCYIQGPHRHIHFIDADGGGYALAAKMMKSKAP